MLFHGDGCCGSPGVGVLSGAGLAGMVGLGPFSQAPQSHQPPLARPGERAPRLAKPTAGRNIPSQSGWRLPVRPGWEPAAAGAKFVPCGEGCLSGFLSLFFEDPNSMGRPHPHPVLLWRGERQLANRNPGDTLRTEAVAPLSTTPTPLCPGTLHICVC